MLDALPAATAMLGDGRYDADWFRSTLTDRGIAPCILSKSNRTIAIPHDRIYIRELLARAKNQKVDCPAVIGIADDCCLGPTIRPHSRNRHLSGCCPVFLLPLAALRPPLYQTASSLETGPGPSLRLAHQTRGRTAFHLKLVGSCLTKLGTRGLVNIGHEQTGFPPTFAFRHDFAN